MKKLPMKLVCLLILRGVLLYQLCVKVAFLLPGWVTMVTYAPDITWLGVGYVLV